MLGCTHPRPRIISHCSFAPFLLRQNLERPYIHRYDEDCHVHPGLNLDFLQLVGDDEFLFASTPIRYVHLFLIHLLDSRLEFFDHS